MLETVLRHLKNWFVVPGGIHPGKYNIEQGSVELPFLTPGQYFRITGSLFNDGLYRYGEYTMIDETFEGAVWALAIPNALLDLVAEIEKWREKYETVAQSPYVSESFGGYSYTKASGTAGGTVSGGWETAFASRLNKWRKI